MLDEPLTVALLRTQLSEWYHSRRRELPWREDPSPYRVWVSEIMLQQTQVATVIPYFERFIAAFPSIEALALADEDSVTGQWAGLGYYRRCRHLHQAAKKVVDVHHGALPQTVDDLLSLPGIGRYTAGAIASIAFGVRAPVLDGNVARVLSRLMALDLEVDSGPGKRALWAAADVLVDPHDPSSHNQAMMELGALVCSPKSPQCHACPLSPHCAAHLRGSPTGFPKKRPRKKAKAVIGVAGLMLDEADRLLMVQRPPDVLLGGLWELPMIEIDPNTTRRDALEAALAERTGMQVIAGAQLATVEHVFTHRRLTLEIYDVTSFKGRPNPCWYTKAAWLSTAELSGVARSRLTDKVLSAVGYEAH